MDGKDESLSGQRLSDGELQRCLSQKHTKKTKKKDKSNILYIPTCCLGGFQEKCSSLIQKQTPAYSVVRHDWIFKLHRVLWSEDKAKEKAYWQQTH